MKVFKIMNKELSVNVDNEKDITEIKTEDLSLKLDNQTALCVAMEIQKQNKNTRWCHD